MTDQFNAKVLNKIPADHHRQVNAFEPLAYIENHWKEEKRGVEVKLLDVGAGAGTTYERFGQSSLKIAWSGLDIEGSPEVMQRPASDLDFHSYDGRTFPFGDRAFDLIFSRQVLEHVRYPDAVISEISRTLKDGGFFFGSFSQLEPYHSNSIFNWTSYGFTLLAEEYGLEVMELRPGIDGLTLSLRSIMGRSVLNHFFAKESPINYLIDAMRQENGAALSVRELNKLKISVAGHIVFLCKKTKA